MQRVGELCRKARDAVLSTRKFWKYIKKYIRRAKIDFLVKIASHPQVWQPKFTYVKLTRTNWASKSKVWLLKSAKLIFLGKLSVKYRRTVFWSLGSKISSDYFSKSALNNFKMYNSVMNQTDFTGGCVGRRIQKFY